MVFVDNIHLVHGPDGTREQEQQEGNYAHATLFGGNVVVVGGNVGRVCANTIVSAIMTKHILISIPPLILCRYVL